MSFWVAVATSALLAIFGYPPRAYQYWFSWLPVRTIGWSIFYLALAGFGGGGIGWLAANLTHAASVGNAYADGALYAIVGTIAIRADLSPRPRNAKHDDDLKAAASLLIGAINWISSFLDSATETATTRWLRNLTDGSLIDESQLVLAFLQKDPATPKPAKDTQRTLYEPIIESLYRGDQSELGGLIRKNNRAHLISFCREFYGHHKTLKSTLGQTPSTDDEVASSARVKHSSLPPVTKVEPADSKPQPSVRERRKSARPKAARKDETSAG